ncbi:MAG: SPOR domain-containing protein [Burkholderiales bacterium]|nr:SPOR domain-containing protein [Burkholderiales bacterium]
MAFFTLRWPGQKGQDSKAKGGRAARAAPAESIEVMRRRARHRLIGAAVLVLLGVVGFPVLFDSQPRPIPVDIPIEIPDRERVAALPAPAPAAPAPAAQAPEAAPPEAAAHAASSERAAAPAPAPAPASAPARPAAAPAFVPSSAPAAQRTEARPAAEPRNPEPRGAEPRAAEPVRRDAEAEAARARALLEGRSADKPAAAVAPAAGRYIVQIGAYAEVEKAREVRLKLERAGIKTYTQVVETPQGKRIRVRVGPFEGHAEADKAAARIKALSLPVSVLQL